MSPDGLGIKLQESGRGIMDAERALGQAQTSAAEKLAHQAYQHALERFRHIQLEVFTVLLGGGDLLREQLEELREQLAQLEARVAEIERTHARAKESSA